MPNQSSSALPQSFATRAAAFAARILPSKARLGVYRLPVVSSAIRWYLNRGVPSGITKVQVAGGPLRGMWMQLDLRNEKYYWLGTYEPELMELLPQVCRPEMCVYDIGANAGYTTLAFATQIGAEGKVFAAEPLPSNARRIRSMAELNDMESRITVVEEAVSDQTGEAVFRVHQFAGMGKLERAAGRSEQYVEEMSVRTVSLADLVARESRPPDLIKIDIEGGGVLIQDDLRKVLGESRPIVLAELHGPEERRALLSAMTANEYSVRTMKRGLPRFDPETKDWKAHVVGFPPR